MTARDYKEGESVSVTVELPASVAATLRMEDVRGAMFSALAHFVAALDSWAEGEQK